MHADDFIALETAALAQLAWGNRLALPAWPYTVEAVVDAVDRQLPPPSGGARRTRALIGLLDELGDLLAGVDPAVATTFAHTVSALAGRRWERLPVPSSGEVR